MAVYREDVIVELLTTNDVAKLAGKSSGWVQWVANTQGLKHLRTRSGMRVFSQADVVRFLMRRQQRRRIVRTGDT